MELPKEFDLDAAMGEMTLGDMEEVERLGGVKFTQLADVGSMPISGLMAIMFVSLRKDNPALTFQDVKNIKLTSLFTDEVVEAEDADPLS